MEVGGGESSPTPTPKYAVSFSVDGIGGTLTAKIGTDPFTGGEEITSPSQIEEGTVITFTATPAGTNYTVDKWTITGGQTVSSGGDGISTAMVKVTEPVTVSVSFKIKTCKITFGVQGENGTLTAEVGDTPLGSSPQNVEAGKVINFTATPSAGYKVEAWILNGNPVTGNTSNTYNHPVTAAAKIKVSFVSTAVIPDNFIADGSKYDVIDKEQKHAFITGRESGNFVGDFAIPATVEYNGITYKIAGITAKDPVFFITSFSIDGASELMSVENGVLFNKEKTKLICYPKYNIATSYTVPDTVKVLGERCFYNSQNLTSLVLPEGLTTIEDYALHYCCNLETVNIPSSVTAIGHNFLASSKVEAVVIPEGVSELMGFQFLDSCSLLKTVDLPSTLTKVHGAEFC